MIKKKILAGILSGVAMSMAVMMPLPVLADAVSTKSSLSLGADLNDGEKAEVLKQLNVAESALNSYNLITITNQDEHDYLDTYLSADIIGTRALSSALVIKTDEGSGINVTTKNISYCTIGMYQNALATAGVENADVTVAGPYPISGTAALVGIMKSYESITGKDISQESMDTATNELVVTADLAENIGDSDKAEELIGAVKDAVVSNNYDTQEEILSAVETAADEIQVQLSQEDMDKIVALMSKIDKLDIDVEALKEQAKDLYNKLESFDLNKLGISDANIQSAENFFIRIWNKIVEFFANLFN